MILKKFKNTKASHLKLSEGNAFDFMEVISFWSYYFKSTSLIVE